MVLVFPQRVRTGDSATVRQRERDSVTARQRDRVAARSATGPDRVSLTTPTVQGAWHRLFWHAPDIMRAQDQSTPAGVRLIPSEVTYTPCLAVDSVCQNKDLPVPRNMTEKQ